ncbi:MAG: imidazole glycerol phosphate synthase subunit HisF [Bacteroidia bacterium]
MLTKRIISCLDVKDGRTVKGVNFEGLRDAGDAVELAVRYCEEGADELVLLDITASHEKRKTVSAFVRNVAQRINIPFTVGGGISSADDVAVLLDNGADKVSVNSAAFRNPELITQLAKRFGSQCVVLAVDAKLCEDGITRVYLSGGRERTESEVLNWIEEAVNRGAGEILLTSMNHDGTKSGFAVELTRLVSERVTVPVIASGGAGNAEHFRDVFLHGKADAALAASLFHFGELPIPVLKQYLVSQQLPIRTSF